MAARLVWWASQGSGSRGRKRAALLVRTPELPQPGFKSAPVLIQERLRKPMPPQVRHGDVASAWVAVSQWSDQTVVVGVTADPVPDDVIFLHDCKSAVIETDANRIEVILAFQLLELQT